MVLIEDLDAVDGQNQVEHHVYNSFGQRKLPVLVLTGYLGAGKTTLLNYILREQHDKKLAVIENEVGEVSVDDALIGDKVLGVGQEDVVVLDNGCVCCNIRADLVRALAAIWRKHETGNFLDGVVIELTGVADPAPVVQSFFMVDSVSEAFYIDNVVALVDSRHVLEQLAESHADPMNKGTAAAQIAFSSMVLLNKTDLVNESHLKDVELRVREINPSAVLLRCLQSRVSLSRLFNVSIFSLGRVLEEQYMDEEDFTKFYQPKMDRSVSNVGVRCSGAVNLFAFQAFLDKYLGEEDTAKDFLRIKGVLEIAGSDSKYIVQCVHMVRTTGFSENWEEGQPRENRIIFIGRGMQGRRQCLTADFESCMVTPLRFSLGDEVRVQVHDESKCLENEHGNHEGHSSGHSHGHIHQCGQTVWHEGVVVRHWDEKNAYRVKLRDESEVLVPMDDCRLIRGVEDSYPAGHSAH
ncbi:CBWD5 [Symbiodinium sp. CCMP2592]|nr:CBWD5 [Symbiodinium sp. CCMP2592]